MGQRRSWRMATVAVFGVTLNATMGLAVGQDVPANEVLEVVFPEASEPTEVRIAAGESLKLRWADAGTDAYLVGVGAVPSRGERILDPQSDVTYTLISGDGPTVRFRSVDVVVEGRKGRGVGNPEFPPPTEYRATIDGVLTGLAYPVLVQRVYHYLQNVCGHQVESTHKPWEPDYTLWTNYAQPTEGGLPRCIDRVPGLDASKRPIGAAFFVRLTPAKLAGTGTSVEIGAIARFRYASEERWRRFEDSAHATAFAQGLRRRLEVLK